MNRIYLDFASLTPLDKRVMKEMEKYSSEEYTNPSALYTSAVKAKRAVEDAKTRIAKVLHTHPDEIIFTSGGTESNQLVLQNDEIKNKINKDINKKLIISSIEHSSIIGSDGVVTVAVGKDGLVDLDLLKKSITPEITLVSVMLVNNEIGVIEPIHEIAKIVRDARKKFKKNIGGIDENTDKNNSGENVSAISRPFPLLHTDASQAGVHLPLHVEKLGIDLMTLDGSKIYGPRGMGMLFVKRGSMKISRAGTENVSGIMGFAMAIEIAEKMREKETRRVDELKNFFLLNLKKINPEIKVNGDIKNSSPHILNISIPKIDNEFFMLQLDAKGIECSTKSACLRDEDESYVLKAICADSKNSLRFSFGRTTTKAELNKTLKTISQILKKS